LLFRWAKEKLVNSLRISPFSSIAAPNAEKQAWIAKKLIQEETQKLEEFFRNLQALPQGAQHQIKMNTPQVTMEKKAPPDDDCGSPDQTPS